MPRVLRKLLPAAVLPAVLMTSAALLHGFGLSVPHWPRGLLRERVLEGFVLPDHLLSFDETAGYVRMYLTGYEEMLREGLFGDTRWVLGLKLEGELIEVSFPAGKGEEAAARYRVNAIGEGGGYYIDGGGRFHFVKLGDGKPSVDFTVGFDPVREPLNGLHVRPSWVALCDRENGTWTPLFGRGRARVRGENPMKKFGTAGAANAAGSVLIALDGLLQVRFAKALELKGSRVYLVSQYPLLSLKGSFFLFGLLIIAVLAILVLVSTGVFSVAVPRGAGEGGREMGKKKVDQDVVDEIDSAVADVASRKTADGEAGAAELAEGEASPGAPPGEEARAEGAVSGTEKKVPGGEKPFEALEKDGIFIKKRV